MERSDHERIVAISKDNFELSRLYQKHQELEAALGKLQQRPCLTAEEEAGERKLKRLKLIGVDQMLEIVAREDGGVHRKVA